MATKSKPTIEDRIKRLDAMKKRLELSKEIRDKRAELKKLK